MQSYNTTKHQVLRRLTVPGKANSQHHLTADIKTKQ